ncbi:MAG: formyltransferase family protein [Patescibacteria group bacterium]
MTDRSISLILAAYGAPGILAIGHLSALGYRPEQVGLLTHGDDERNRPLLACAADNGISVCQSAAKESAAKQWLQERRPRLLFSLHYRDRIPGDLLAIPTGGCVNLHPSLLPKHRGCFSVPWAILGGDDVTGFSYHWMTEKFDEGNILLQRIIPIGKYDSAYTLFHRQIAEGLAVFPEAVALALRGERGTPQAPGGSYHPRAVPYGGRIDPSWDRGRVSCFIRALDFPPYPPAMVELRGKKYPVPSMEEYDRLLSVHR